MKTLSILKKKSSKALMYIINTLRVKKHAYLILFLFLISHLHIFSQSKYFIKDNEGFDFILNISVDGNTINGFTRENALLDYTSKLNYKIIKAASNLKHPEIIRFSATLTNGDFEGTYDYLFSSYKIVGKIDTDSISYSLFKESNELYKSFKGGKISHYANKDYVKLAEEVIKITEENIFDPKIIESKKWTEYCQKLLSGASNTADDLEFQIGLFALARKIGFSHYYISKNVISTNTLLEKPSLTEINNNTVLLKIRSFLEKEENIKPLLDSIQQKSYRNLIIDLRDNSGGRFEPVLCIADFLTDKEFIGGFYPNRNWYEEYNRFPNKDDIDKFHLMNGDTIQNHSKYGFYVSTKGTENNFKGNTYFLANKKTGSAAEAFIIGAKEYKMAKIVGQTTAGGLLYAKKFRIDDDISLMIPTNDFISYNGYRIDQKGIDPDIETKKGKELERVLEIIKKDDR